ncbi:DUF3427 domain-containing protein [Haloferula sp. A504]|uniref:DUF3427 domain-containing protein n=1 Tax=Haloferula sp. A504 TaxID=3373601 RepID=UPI0031BED396|nr:DUF3427 domain-containing protein [Verrucomicrobiaceae bacterium E54]
MSEEEQLAEGIYETLVDEELGALLASRPEMAATLEKLDDESAPHTYSQFVWHLLHRALRGLKKERRLALVNRLIELLSAQDGLEYLERRKLLEQPKQLLREIRASALVPPSPIPSTPMSVSSLLTGAGEDPALEHELRAEMSTADRVDILVSFIKWSGLRLLRPAFETLAERGVPVRIITTSYMGASDPEALEFLARLPGVTIRVSYDTERTRLHAKAYHFIRKTGLSTAYIGSANMSRAAMTSGLEWTVKVTAQDMPHILDRFGAEFETYWSREEFEIYDKEQADRFRRAIQVGRSRDASEGPRFFVEVTPHAFQERILENLAAVRETGSFRNLVVAATGTGKTVVAAFDYARQRKASTPSSRLLFIAHRKEILQQALDCFRLVLRDPNFGELMVDGAVPLEWNHVFASIQSWNNRRPWEDLGTQHFDHVIVDEAHHGTAGSYRPVFDHLEPRILLGLTATPERMDGSRIVDDFDGRFAAEIRLPEALEEKLLCPFHYFGVTDPVAVSEERFWVNGKYDTAALTEVYTGDDIRALNRVDRIIERLHHYQPDLSNVRGVGFCASVKHAKFMAAKFNQRGLVSAVVVGETSQDERRQRIADFRSGKLPFLFTVDVLSEGLDVPEINLVMFLRPTESLTVFLQQLGRGLRNAPEKDCLTVLDFVGQTHRKYRVDRKFAALLPSTRRRIDMEIEADFPNLPAGCSIQLERVAREHVLRNIREGLGNLQAFIPEAIRTFEREAGLPLSFGNFVDATGLSALDVLGKRTWSEWKALAGVGDPVEDPDLTAVRQALRRVSFRTDPEVLNSLARVADGETPYAGEDRGQAMLHYLLWGKQGAKVGVASYEESFAKFQSNRQSIHDLTEVVDWRRKIHDFPLGATDPTTRGLIRLHGAYGSGEIKAAFGLADLQRAGMTGTGVLCDKATKTYLHLVTFRKEEADFAPTTRYRDYPISRSLLHWESQSGTSQESPTGQNYINFKAEGYRILFFARLNKREQGETAPFVFLGAARELRSYQGNRPIEMVWELEHPMPAALFEEARTA